jgi:hypothetical protein
MNTTEFIHQTKKCWSYDEVENIIKKTYELYSNPHDAEILYEYSDWVDKMLGDQNIQNENKTS